MNKEKASLSEWKKIISIIKPIKLNNPTENSYYASLLKKPKMRRYYDISTEKPKSVQTKKDKHLIAVLSLLGFDESSIDLDSNKGKFKDGSERKLGRVLRSNGFSKWEEYLKIRNNNSDNTNNYLLVISAHPFDIINCSTGRSWNSCMNYIEGSEFPYMLSELVSDVRFGMVAYLCKPGDKAIKSPLGRVFINAYTDMLSVSSEYKKLNKSGKIEEAYFYDSYENDFSYNKSSTRGAAVPVIFDIACSSYGRFPESAKIELSKILEEEINSKSDKEMFNNYLEFISYYIDKNEFEIDLTDSNQSLNYSKILKKANRAKRIRSPKNNKFTIDNIINKIVKVDLKNRSYSNLKKLYTDVYKDWWTGNIKTGTTLSLKHRIYKLLNSRGGRNTDSQAFRRLAFHQMKNLICQNPKILNCKEIRQFLETKGEEYALLLNVK